MKLQTTTDYAIRVMSFLYSTSDLTTAKDLSERINIPKQYLYHILRQLRESGMIDVVQGRWGGYRINEAKRQTTLYDIIRCMEGDVQINACLGPNGYCNRDATSACPVHAVLEGVQEQLIGSLSKVCLSDIQIVGHTENKEAAIP